MSAIIEGIPKLAERINWFPGHMYKALREVKERVGDIDTFLEIRDSRIPFSSRNYEFDQFIKSQDKAIKDFNSIGINSLPINVKEVHNVNKILNLVKELSPPKYKTIGIWMMVNGMPNVGKSSILNALRSYSTQIEGKRSSARTGTLPCITKSQTGFKVNLDPLMYIVDTPGIMVPQITDDEIGLKLALTGSIKDSIVGKEFIISYMLHAFHKYNMKTYMNKWGMQHTPKHSDELISFIQNKYQKQHKDAAMDYILKEFRSGSLGKITLDHVDIS